MTELRDVLVIGIVLVAALAVSACLETETNLEEGVPVATTSAVTTSTDETATNATDADNRIEKTPVAATPAGEPHPVEVDGVPVRNLPITALSNTSADEENPVGVLTGAGYSSNRMTVCVSAIRMAATWKNWQRSGGTPRSWILRGNEFFMKT